MKNSISNLLRILLCLLLIISAALKFYNISSFANTVQLFTDAYIIGTSHSIVYFFSVFICFLELFVGTIGLFDKFRTISLPLMIIMFSVFTLVTFVNAFFPTSLGSIQDCKCFGDFLHISPFTSFIKSVVLLALSLLSILLSRKKHITNSVRMAANIILCLSLFYYSESTFAQQKTKKTGEARIVVSVNDSYTNVGLPAFVTLLDKDSAVIDTATCKLWRSNSTLTLYVPKISGEYMVRAEYPGYKTTVVKQYFDFTENLPGWGFPIVKLKRLPTATDSLRSVELGEVVVRGTRLQVAYRGDTLVYDAQAFNIPEGAMLETLVRQLPGAELKANGDVYINGKRLDYITLNGNDFYKGNNKIILENLPYFVVKQLKVYYKDPPFALVKPLTDAGKDYVLDVVMKREYATGSIANMEAGYGTDSRWKAKAFGLRYNDYTRFSLFGNLNNVNEDRTPGTNGDWSPKKQSRGLLTTKQAGFNLNLNNATKTLSLDQSTLLEWSDNNNTSWQRSETFSPEGNIFGGKTSTNSVKDFKFTDETQLNVSVGRSIISTQHYITYTDRVGANKSADSTYRTSLINTDQYISLTDSRNLYGNGAAMWSFLSFGPNSTSLVANYSFGILSHDRGHTLRNIRYMNSEATEGRNDYRDNTSRRYRYKINLAQDFYISPRMSIDFNAGYQQYGERRDNDYYHFYQYGGRYENDLVLPSTADSLMAATDRGNSYNYFTIGRGLSTMLLIRYNWKNTSVHLSANYIYSHEHIHYCNNDIDTVAQRGYGSWNPNLQVQHKWKKNKFSIRYNTVHTRPNFATLMPLTNNSNTLNVHLNNPNLRSQLRNTVNMELDIRPGGMKPAWWLKYEIITLNRAWGNRAYYNTTTGGYTFITDNVNGNWNTALSFGMNGILNKQKRWRYDVTAKVGYIHSVDFSTAYNGMNSELSRVNTLKPETTWKLSYNKGNFSAGALAKFSGNFSHEEEYSQRDMNVREYQFGINALYTVPVVKLAIGTDLNLYARDGYEMATMNTNEWIWNAAISRPLLKGKMVFKVEMYDILHQLSARSYKMNAQSRVETYYNSIPHYFMLSVSYKFAKSPKKDKCIAK